MMDISKLFDSKSTQLFWRALDPSHIVGLPAPQLFVKGQSYFVVRLAEMYLASARKLWRQMYPVLHSYIACGTFLQLAIVGPGQLSELGDTNLDRISNLNQILAGPVPYDGQEVNLLAGLYAVPGHDSAKALIDTLGALAMVAGASYGAALPTAGIVKAGIDSVLGLDQATLHLGVHDSFSDASTPFSSGYFACIGAPDQGVDATQLWLVHGRLLKGSNPVSATAYTDHDYMVLAIERLDSRDDWQNLPSISDFLPKFANVMSDAEFTVEEKRNRLAGLWAPFLQILDNSPHLTGPDRDRIATRIGDEFVTRLTAQDQGNPFLKRAA
jgi:hypothetical protein